MLYNSSRQRFSKLKIIFFEKNNFQFTKPTHNTFLRYLPKSI